MSVKLRLISLYWNTPLNVRSQLDRAQLRRNNAWTTSDVWWRIDSYLNLNYLGISKVQIKLEPRNEMKPTKQNFKKPKSQLWLYKNENKFIEIKYLNHTYNNQYVSDCHCKFWSRSEVKLQCIIIFII